jgi:hypothetical protein
MPDPDHPIPDSAVTPAEAAAEEASPETLSDAERAALAEEASRQEDA